MKTTLLLDNVLIEEAKKATGLFSKTAVIHEGLRALVEREARRTLILAKGTAPKGSGAPSRRVF